MKMETAMFASFQHMLAWCLNRLIPVRRPEPARLLRPVYRLGPEDRPGC